MKTITNSNTTRIASNTLLLYIRTFITMLIALFTSRVVLRTLGVEDYGLYNVVGGVVTMMSIVTAGLSTATQRFLSYELGLEDKSGLPKVFNTCFYTHVGLALVLLVLAETIGLWFVNYKLQVPEGRMVAANIIYQFSIASICVNILATPFSACIISHEKFTVYAVVGIVDAVLKLIIAYLIGLSSKDKLVFYGGLMALISVFDFYVYKVVCNKHFWETKLKLLWDSSLFKKVFSFTSWTMLGQGAMIGANQGNNILINIFYSVSVNAASAIANQVNVAISSFTSNFFAAYQPQITKSYASHNYPYTIKLVNGTSKLSFFLIFLVSIPLILNIDFVLKIWLGQVPQYTSIFCTIFIISSTINAVGNPYWTAIFASGNIKNLQILSTIAYLFDIVMVYIFFSFGWAVYFAPLTKLFIDIIITSIRVVYAKKAIPGLTIKLFVNSVVMPILLTAFIICTLSEILIRTLHFNGSQIILTIVVFTFSIIVVYYFGLNSNERLFVKSLIRSRLRNNGE